MAVVLNSVVSNPETYNLTLARKRTPDNTEIKDVDGQYPSKQSNLRNSSSGGVHGSLMVK